MRNRKIISNVLYRSSLLLIAGLLSINTSCAQTEKPLDEMTEWYLFAPPIENSSYFPYEISVWGASGKSRLDYNSNVGRLSAGAGGAFGVAYTYFFNTHWGVSAGSEYAFYQRVIAVDGLSDAFATSDILGNRINYRSHIDKYEEQQRLGMVNIPFTLLYQTVGNTSFYTSLGFKLGLPIYGYYTTSSSVLTTSGYYPDYDQLEIWQNNLGYGTFPIKGSKTNLNFGTSLMGTLETGMKWNVGIGKILYTGIYMDYGFNNILQGDYSGNRLVEYNRENPATPLMHGMLTAQYPIDKVAPLAVGLKVKFGFSVSGKAQKVPKVSKAKEFPKTESKYNDYEFFNPKEEEIRVQEVVEPIQPKTVITDVQDIIIKSSECDICLQK